ncbi:hypothetical protein ACJ2A9_20050 [Anaerobacillus sp. MEB173]|uniref:hypothetical protein n=1 Tax=Anaerobacillus sp. MEB173 TaxID=3383345 RepID=UPI003F8E85EF
MLEFGMFDLATIAAVVAALVTVVGNAFNIDKKYRALLAVGFACIIIFVPQEWSNQVLTALVIGLTASGVYSQVKPREFEEKLPNETQQQSTTNRHDDTPY